LLILRGYPRPLDALTGPTGWHLIAADTLPARGIRATRNPAAIGISPL
jgi:hypothetical protein